MREIILKILHKAHFGIVKTKARARKIVFWPKINKDIENFIKSCEQCNKYGANVPKIPLKQWEPAEKAWQRIHIDFAGPIFEINFLVVIDAYSKYPFIKIMKSTTSEATIDALEEIFTLFGYPSVIVSDNGPQLISENFETYLARNGIIHKKSAPYHPQSNGAAERFVQTAKNSIKKMIGMEINPTKKALNKIIATFLQEYRATPHPTTEQSPAKLFLKREIKTNLEMILSRDQIQIEKIWKANEKQKQNFDQNVGTKCLQKSFAVGDAVWINSHGDQHRKWKPGLVQELIGNAMLKVEETETGKQQIVHFDQTKPRRLLLRGRTGADEAKSSEQ